ncbi:MAG TPA: DUF423 domain-containing protein [Flavobacteriaceae bacterium]|nr:DUF423 domain-containing protein [Flavobacteriaceae bacterium]
MNRQILIIATIMGLLSVVLGAFGAHGLKEQVAPEMFQSFETGVKYQMYHALVLLFLGITTVFSDKAKRAIFWPMLIGVVMFSGSIYLLSTSEITGINFKPFALVTPLGGTVLIVSWCLLLVQCFRLKK